MAGKMTSPDSVEGQFSYLSCVPCKSLLSSPAQTYSTFTWHKRQPPPEGAYTLCQAAEGWDVTRGSLSVLHFSTLCLRSSSTPSQHSSCSIHINSRIVMSTLPDTIKLLLWPHKGWSYYELSITDVFDPNSFAYAKKQLSVRLSEWLKEYACQCHGEASFCPQLYWPAGHICRVGIFCFVRSL